MDAIELGDAFVAGLGEIAAHDRQHAGHQRALRALDRERLVAIRSIEDPFGGAVDLVAIGRGLDVPLLPAEDAGRAARVLAEYERDIDLFSRRRLQEIVENARLRLGSQEPGSADDRAGFELRLRMDVCFSWLDGVNAGSSLRVLRALPEERRAEWDIARKRARWPGVYGPGRVHRTRDAALGLADLTDEQRAAIADEMSRHTLEAEPASVRWILATIALHSARRSAGMGLLPDDPEADRDRIRAVEDARAARHEIDGRFVERLLAILTPRQRDLMPSRAGGRDGGGGG